MGHGAGMVASSRASQLGLRVILVRNKGEGVYALIKAWGGRRLRITPCPASLPLIHFVSCEPIPAPPSFLSFPKAIKAREDVLERLRIAGSKLDSGFGGGAPVVLSPADPLVRLFYRCELAGANSELRAAGYMIQSARYAGPGPSCIWPRGRVAWCAPRPLGRVAWYGPC